MPFLLIGISESSIQFVLYEKFKSMALERNKMKGEKTLHGWEYMYVAGTAKLFAAVTTYPHEVIRTRLREQRAATLESPHKYTGIVQVCITSSCT